MIVRYATTQDGIDDECINVCCASEEIIQKMKDNYYKDCKRWIIERDVLNPKGKIIKKFFYNKKCNFRISKAGCIEFESKEEGEKFLKEHLDEDLFFQAKDIEDKEGKFKGFDIKYRVVPFMTFQLPHIGSYSCEHCPYCYGRNKKKAGFELVGWNNRISKDDWDFEEEEEDKFENIKKNLIMREAYYIKCSAIFIQDKMSMKIKIQRWLYQIWVNKLEQFLINFSEKYHIKPLYNKLNYGWWF